MVSQGSLLFMHPCACAGWFSCSVSFGSLRRCTCMGATRWLWSVGVRVARVCVPVLSGGFSLLSGMVFTGGDGKRFRI